MSRMVSPELALWEENFCLPFYLGNWECVNSVYLATQLFYASSSAYGEAQDLWGTYATYCGTGWAGMNLAFLTEPVRALERFRGRLERLLSFYGKLGTSWILVIPEQWVAPQEREPLHTFLQTQGFNIAMEAHAVLANSVKPPIPVELDVQPANGNAEWQYLAEINASAWSVPVEWISPLFASEQFQQQARGYIGSASAKPVSGLVKFPAGGYDFLAWWATVPGFRGRGYGEQLIRHAATQTTSERPLLAISSPQGLETWLRCGFEQQGRFRLYLAPGT